MGTNGVDVAKIAKLVEAWRVTVDQQTELIVELDNLLNGRVGIGDKLKQFEQAWQAAWSTRYPGRYLFTYVKDRPQEKRLLKVFSMQELQARMIAYVKNSDPFYVKARHAFGVFVASINSHAVETTDLDDLGAIACQHTPRCKSDVEHTQVKARELRECVR